jgi:siroheme synthase-like protein
VSALLPVFLKLAGRSTLVVGGGTVAACKAGELLDAGAHVVAVSLAFVDAFPAVTERLHRAFQAGDARGATIVFACTGDPAVDDAVARDAEAHGALVNVVDRPEACGFYSGAIVRRGPLVVAVGTSGASPTLARYVRDRINEVLPAGVGVLGEVLGSARPRLLARYPAMPERTRILDTFVKRAWWRFFAGPTRADLARDIEVAVERELLANNLTHDARANVEASSCT